MCPRIMNDGYELIRHDRGHLFCLRRRSCPRAATCCLLPWAVQSLETVNGPAFVRSILGATGYAWLREFLAQHPAPNTSDMDLSALVTPSECASATGDADEIHLITADSKRMFLARVYRRASGEKQTVYFDHASLCPQFRAPADARVTYAGETLLLPGMRDPIRACQAFWENLARAGVPRTLRLQRALRVVGATPEGNELFLDLGFNLTDSDQRACEQCAPRSTGVGRVSLVSLSLSALAIERQQTRETSPCDEAVQRILTAPR